MSGVRTEHCGGVCLQGVSHDVTQGVDDLQLSVRHPTQDIWIANTPNVLMA
jgi:hypothetical protein